MVCSDSKTVSNTSNIQLCEIGNDKNQMWQIEYLNNGYYKIASAIDPNYVLDVAAHSAKAGANVGLYKSHGGDNQQWAIKKLEDGNYVIISKLGKIVLDIYGSRTAPGTNVLVYTQNETNNQKFAFEKVWNPEKTVEDGNYVINLSMDSNKVLSTYNEMIENNSNVQIDTKNYNWSQIWQIEYLNNGYYKIASAIDPDYVLDVAAHSAKAGANVGLYKSHGGDNQQWAIKKLEDGNYVIISKLGKIVLDIYGSRTAPGTNVLVYTQNETNNQKFIFEKTDAKPIKDGYYKIGNMTDKNNFITIENSYLANNSNIILSDENNSNNQRWHIKHIKNGYYTISSAFNDNYLLDISSGSYNSINNVQLYKKYDYDGQLWYIKYSDGVYVISSKKNEKVISQEFSNNEKENVIVDKNTNSDEQKYSFEETEKIEEEIPNYSNLFLNDGYYIIETALNNSYSLDIYGNYKFNGTNVEIYNSKKSLNQIWYLKNLTDGYYSITSASNRDIGLDSYDNNVNINKYLGTDSQMWILKDTGDGFATIVNKHSNKAIDTETINLSNGVNVILNDITYSPTQKYKITPYNSTKIYKGIDVSSHNGYIDWEAAAKDIDFAILRLGYGGGSDGGDDSQFVTNVKACEDYNIPYGVYLYSYALNSDIDTKVEIEHVSNSLKYANPNLGTKVFFDMEDADGWKKRHGIYDNNQLLNTITNKFCAGVESLGLSCGIYANVDWLTNKLNAQELAKKYTIWVAIWPDNANINSFSSAYNLRPAYNLTTYNYWQFTSNGRINGISGTVDLDLGYDIFDK